MKLTRNAAVNAELTWAAPPPPPPNSRNVTGVVNMTLFFENVLKACHMMVDFFT